MDARLRDKIVMCLAQSHGVVPQIKRYFGTTDGGRCALGLIAERIFGARLLPGGIGMHGEQTLFPDAAGHERMIEAAGDDDRFWALAARNNAGESFDDLAKWVKTWEVSQ